MPVVAVSGSFDDLRSQHVRLLQEAGRRGNVHVKLWSDVAVEAATGARPKFPQEERQYFVQAIRYVAEVEIVDRAVECEPLGIADEQLAGFPVEEGVSHAHGRKKVLVTGCYDWLHTGHVRFFEEVSTYGDLYVCVGQDANIELLKGKGHPLFRQDERRYMVQAIRYVTQALVSSGMGWLDAEPEIRVLRPDIYAVNEDGDKPEKKEYCQQHGIEYLVLKRLPKPGLQRRQSTVLRGF